jgi:hypothetical protein
VTDAQGHCAGGVLEANNGDTQVTRGVPVTVQPGAKCTGNAVGEAAGY